MTIDGVEKAVEPWGGTSDPSLTDGGKFRWKALGPNHWNYAGATHMTTDNVTNHRTLLQERARLTVTWLLPSGAGAVVTKRGGTTAQSLDEPLAEGQPGYNEYGGWMGLDGEWYRVRGWTSALMRAFSLSRFPQLQ